MITIAREIVNRRDIGMGRTWQIFVKIRLLLWSNTVTGANHSATRTFSIGMNIKDAVASAWVGQADVPKIEVKDRNHGENCQHSSVKSETRLI